MTNSKTGFQSCFQFALLSRSIIDQTLSRSRLELACKNMTVNARYAQKDKPISTLAIELILTRLTITPIENTSTITHVLEWKSKRVTGNIQFGIHPLNNIVASRMIIERVNAGIKTMIMKISTATELAP